MSVENHLRDATPQEKADVQERFGADWQRVEATIHSAEVVHRSRDAKHRRYIRLVAIADEFQKVVAPYVACQGKGCSHCCKQAVNITEREAILIGEHLKRTPARLPMENDPYKILARLEADVERYTAQPCPMLAPDGACTIYPVRPLCCRLQHSLEDTPEKCDLESGRHWVRKLTTQAVTIVSVEMDINRSIGDIREFFP